MHHRKVSSLLMAWPPWPWLHVMEEGRVQGRGHCIIDLQGWAAGCPGHRIYCQAQLLLQSSPHQSGFQSCTFKARLQGGNMNITCCVTHEHTALWSPSPHPASPSHATPTPSTTPLLLPPSHTLPPAPQPQHIPRLYFSISPPVCRVPDV